jgi:hypothetical protein
MHNTVRRTAGAAPASLSKRARELRHHLGRLLEELDDTSVRAALKLMLSEAGGALHKQRGLIALERLDGRTIAQRMDELRERQSTLDQLLAFYADQTKGDDDFAPEQSRACGKQPLLSGNQPTARLVSEAFITNRPKHEEPAAPLHGDLADSQPPVGTRHGRHGIGAAR